MFFRLVYLEDDYFLWIIQILQVDTADGGICSLVIGNSNL